ncbi:efflux RND transporter periplasmic adaptor subunit [Bacillus sp. HMF5848]|uniref:efflux RND transporter periplasmic adaptor subunit n=1 Tax=Bacillus sp. HMF5848 TaxID=2495421 RepID=UPI000F7B7AF8|nr:efflux RND transporter periplasmic adaptor subunit [Bacillus sp. HMF5848]RSK28720.1 efflux RND transporter periplasmic adaptor subunit [Bacillus sp. HMF5848]
MKKLIVLLASSAILLSACGQKDEAASKVSAEETVAQKVKVTEVTAIQLGKETYVEAELLPSIEAVVNAELSGTVMGKFFDVGESVQKGDILIKLDNDDAQLNYEMESLQSERASVQYNKSKAEREFAITAAEKNKQEKEMGLKDAEIAVTTQEKAIQSAELAVQQAQSGFNTVDRLYKAKLQLHESGAISKEELLQAETQRNDAQISLQLAKDRLELEKLGLEQAKRQVERAKMALQLATDDLSKANASYDEQLLTLSSREAQVAKDRAAQSLEKIQITAPVDGLVTNIDVIVGGAISPGQQLAKIEQQNPLHIRAYVSESDLQAVQNTKKMGVYLPILDKKLSANVLYISRSYDKAKSGYEIKLTVPNDDYSILPGMSAQLLVDDSTAKQVMTVPVSSVITEEGKSYVFVIENNVAEKREVKVGRKTTELVEIMSGVKKGEKVAVVGTGLLEDGSKVDILD